MTQSTQPATVVMLDLDDAQELAAGIGALGSWLYQAPEATRCDFARHAFPDPAAPGANTGEFLDALHHGWQRLCDILDERPGQPPVTAARRQAADQSCAGTGGQAMLSRCSA